MYLFKQWENLFVLEQWEKLELKSFLCSKTYTRQFHPQQALKKQRRDIDALAILKEQLELTEQARAARRVRLAANRQHRAMQQPPKLGPVPFVPEPVHVMLSEEVNGSLRTVKAAPMVLRDRYVMLAHGSMCARAMTAIIIDHRPLLTTIGTRACSAVGSSSHGCLQRPRWASVWRMCTGAVQKPRWRGRQRLRRYGRKTNRQGGKKQLSC